MRDLSLRNILDLAFDYVLFVQRNAVKMIKSNRNIEQYQLTDYLVEELNYTPGDAEEIVAEIKQFMDDYGKGESEDS